jgi:hypothetical protein
MLAGELDGGGRLGGEGDLADLSLGQLGQHEVRRADLVHHFHDRRVQRVPRNSRWKSPCASSRTTGTRWRANSSASIAPAGPAPTMQQVVSRTSRILFAGEPSANPLTLSPHPAVMAARPRP